MRAGDPLEEVLREQEDVAGAGAQRRHRDRDDVDPVEQILAEPLLVDLGLEIAVGRGDHAGLERDLLVAADRADLALLQHAQQLDLHLDRHLADLVEEDRAGAGLHEQPGARPLGVGERAADVTEQLALEQRRRHRRAVDRDERLVAARRQVVKRAGDQLLAGAGLAGDQHGGVAVGDPADHLDRLADRGARAGDAVDRRVACGHLCAGGVTSRLRIRCSSARLDRDREGVDLHRLGDEVVRAGADRGDRGVEAALAGEHERQEIRIALAQLLAELDAGHAGHLDVGHHDVGRIRPQVLEALLCGVDGIDVEAALAQAIAQQDGGVVVIVDDQDGSVHSEVIPFCRQ